MNMPQNVRSNENYIVSKVFPLSEKPTKLSLIPLVSPLKEEPIQLVS